VQRRGATARGAEPQVWGSAPCIVKRNEARIDCLGPGRASLLGGGTAANTRGGSGSVSNGPSDGSSGRLPEICVRCPVVRIGLHQMQPTSPGPSGHVGILHLTPHPVQPASGPAVDPASDARDRHIRGSRGP
jgi:hypothetical protein